MKQSTIIRTSKNIMSYKQSSTIVDCDKSLKFENAAVLVPVFDELRYFRQLSQQRSSLP